MYSPGTYHILRLLDEFHESRMAVTWGWGIWLETGITSEGPRAPPPWSALYLLSYPATLFSGQKVFSSFADKRLILGHTQTPSDSESLRVLVGFRFETDWTRQT